MKSLRSGFCLVLFCCLLLSLCACVKTPSEPELTELPEYLRILPNTEKLERSVPLPETGLTALEAFMAVNEAEGMQFAVRFDEDVTNARVTLSSLMSEKGDTLDDVVLYKEHYVFVTDPLQSYPAGYYPDALIEAFDGSDGRMRTDLTDIKAGENQAWWITVTTPIGQAPGVYTGTATFSCDQKDDVVMPVSVTVWDIELPEETVYESCFGLWGHNLYAATHTWAEMESIYWDFFLKYRMSCGVVPTEAVGDSFNRTVTSVEDAEKICDAILAYVEKNPRVSKFRIGLRGFMGPGNQEPGMIADNVENQYIYQALKNKDMFDLVYIAPWDEPAASGVIAQYITMIGEEVREAFPELRVIIATTEYISAFESFWTGECPKISFATEDLVNHWAEMGVPSWWYTCCDPQPPFPTYLIPDKLICPRLLHWIAKDYGLTGELYWGATLTNKLNSAGSAYDVPVDVWTMPYVTPGSPGDGYLVYPGLEGDGYVDRNIIVPTLRLEAIRDGIEDYLMLDLLEKKYDGLMKTFGISDFTVDELMDGLYYDDLYHTTSRYSDDSALFASIRRKAAEALMNDDGVLIAPFTSPVYGDLFRSEIRVYASESANVLIDGQKAVYENGCFRAFVSGEKAGELITVSVNGKEYRESLSKLSDAEFRPSYTAKLNEIAAKVGCSAANVSASYEERYFSARNNAMSNGCLGGFLTSEAPILVVTTEIADADYEKTSTKVVAYAPVGSTVTCSVAEDPVAEETEHFATFTYYLRPQETAEHDAVFTVVTPDGQTFTSHEYIRQDQGDMTWIISEPTDIKLRRSNNPVDFEITPELLEGKTKIAVSMAYVGGNSYASAARLAIVYDVPDAVGTHPEDYTLGKVSAVFQPGKTVTAAFDIPNHAGVAEAIRLCSTQMTANDDFVIYSLCLY